MMMIMKKVVAIVKLTMMQRTNNHMEHVQVHPMLSATKREYCKNAN